MAAASHEVRIGLMKERSAGNQRHRNFHGVHQVVILFTGLGPAPHTENSIFAVEVDGDFLRKIVGNEIRDAPAEIDVSAVGQLERGTLSDLLSGQTWPIQKRFLWRGLSRHSVALSPARHGAQKSLESSRFPVRWRRRARA